AVACIGSCAQAVPNVQSARAVVISVFIVVLHMLWAAHECRLPNAAACPRSADQAGALPCRHSFMAVRFFVVLLPRAGFAARRQTFVRRRQKCAQGAASWAYRSASIRASDQGSLLLATAAGARAGIGGGTNSAGLILQRGNSGTCVSSR